MEKQKRIPKRRFREFLEAGEWEERRIGDGMYIKSRIGWQQLSRDEYLERGDYYLITGTDITEDNRVDLRKSYYVSEWRYNQDDKIKVYDGDIIVTKDGTIGKVAIIENLDKPATLNSHLLVLRDQTGELDNRFLLQILESDIFTEFISSTQTGSTLTGLPQKTFVEFRFKKPELNEQKELANFLGRLDTLISLHQQRLSKLKALKQAYLTEMFPAPGEKRPRRRFKRFSGDWEEKRLGDITESYSGGTPSVDVKKFYGGDIPFIRSAEINSDSTELYLTKDGFNSSSAKMVEKGCILYALYGATSGETGLSKIKGAINQAILAIIPHDGYDASFIMQWLRLNKGKIIETYLQGGQGNLSGNIVKDLVLDIPEYEEQKIIGKFVCNLDCLIEKAENRISKLQSLKQAYLSELFV